MKLQFPLTIKFKPFTFKKTFLLLKSSEVKMGFKCVGDGGAETVKHFRLALLYVLNFYFSA